MNEPGDTKETLFQRMSRIARERKQPGMKLFHKIEGSTAIVRVGIYYKQLELYARGDRVFIKLPGGFCRVTAKFGGEYGTANPSTKVIEFEAEGVEDVRGELRYKDTQ